LKAKASFSAPLTVFHTNTAYNSGGVVIKELENVAKKEVE